MLAIDKGYGYFQILRMFMSITSCITTKFALSSDGHQLFYKWICTLLLVYFKGENIYGPLI